MNQTNKNEKAASALTIRTWRQRLGVAPEFPLHAPNDVERAMEAEIAELRAAVLVSSAPETSPVCALPPAGWHCTRVAGHDGPCAALPSDDAGLLQLNQDTQAILGRPNFACIGIANQLRNLGHTIGTQAEYEQAAVIHFLLNMYQKHGTAWREHASEYLHQEPK
jgi:hypothetical protein